jgi:hypothetical protein
VRSVSQARLVMRNGPHSSPVPTQAAMITKRLWQSLKWRRGLLTWRALAQRCTSTLPDLFSDLLEYHSRRSASSWLSRELCDSSKPYQVPLPRKTFRTCGHPISFVPTRDASPCETCCMLMLQPSDPVQAIERSRVILHSRPDSSKLRKCDISLDALANGACHA